jgi:MSHA pilin protein MshA
LQRKEGIPMNKSRQAGFTLIELVMVIVILGVLAAVALPKFVNVDDDAKQAAVNGVAGALSSGSAINYASRKANSSKGVAIANCQDVEKTMQTYTGTAGTGLPSGYTITTAPITAESTVTDCVVTGNSKTANFTATGIN